MHRRRQSKCLDWKGLRDNKWSFKYRQQVGLIVDFYFQYYNNSHWIPYKHPHNMWIQLLHTKHFYDKIKPQIATELNILFGLTWFNLTSVDIKSKEYS